MMVSKSMRAMALVAISTCLPAVWEARAAFAEEPAVITPGADGRRKINLAGRQRMLSQYMAKGICLISIGIGDKDQMDDIWAVQALFESTLAGLRNGSPGSRLLPEKDPAIITALETVGAMWTNYRRAVEQGDLDAVAAQNGAVLKAINDAVGLIEKRYAAAGLVRPDIAAAINISGRQRMLSQKASKELCLIAAGKDMAENRTNLKGTMELFDTSMRGLRQGDPALGLKPAPAGEITEQIAQAEAVWGRFKTILNRAVGGGKPSRSEMETAASLNLAVLGEVNAIVELYETVAD